MQGRSVTPGEDLALCVGDSEGERRLERAVKEAETSINARGPESMVWGLPRSGDRPQWAELWEKGWREADGVRRH